MPEKAWHLWGILADGRPHHVRDLAAEIDVAVRQLNGYWQQLPERVQASLKQNDGFWQLRHAAAVVSGKQAQGVALKTGFAVQSLNETTSTNDVLWEAWQAGEEIHRQAVVALMQSAGRGRLNRTWHNQLGQTLMFSFAHALPLGAQGMAALPLVVGLIAQQALASQNIHVQLKWPNDLVIGARKMGGVLVESKIRGERWHAVVGIGINVQTPAAPELQDIATSCQSQQPYFNSQVFLCDVFEKIDAMLPRFLEQGFGIFQAAYTEQLRDVGQILNVFERGEHIASGTMLGVSEQGGLLLQNEHGQTQEYVNGEVSTRLQGVPPPDQGALLKNEVFSMSHNQPQMKQVPSTHPQAVQKQARYFLLDGGNSQLKWAWVDAAGDLHFGGRAPYNNLQAFADFMRHQKEDIPVVGCAVCGAKKMAAVEQAVLGRDIRWLPSMRHALGVTNHYYKVQQHGSDRWFNVLGSRVFSQNSCVVVSCGTAITVDAVTNDNHYLGGSIMPGFNLMKEVMAAKTANLHQPIGKAYPFATSTSNALASGMQDAASGAVVLMHHRLQERQQGGKVDIILTGGGAAKIEQHLPRALILDSDVQIVDNLVLFGLKNWVEHTCNY